MKQKKKWLIKKIKIQKPFWYFRYKKIQEKQFKIKKIMINNRIEIDMIEFVKNEGKLTILTISN